MGLFSRHKKDEGEKKMAPPLPPSPSSAKTSLGGSDLPSVSDMQKSSSSSSMTPPPSYGSSFDDIKSEVSQIVPPSSLKDKVAFDDEDFDDTSSLETPAPLGMSSMSKMDKEMDSSKDSFDLNDESLFDFSDVALDSKTSAFVPKEAKVTSMSSSSSFEREKNSNSFAAFSKEEKPGSSLSPNNSYFVTTQQYRMMLEIIEGVKSRVKDAHETHVRLSDIKAEEDIEYENLRKDFQFVEDKLYELDSIIFER